MKALENNHRLGETASQALLMLVPINPAVAQTQQIIVSIPDHKLPIW